MRVLAIDPGSTTGWALGSVLDGKPVIGLSGTWNIAPRRGESSGWRYIKFRRYLEEVLAAYPGLKAVVYEMQHHRGASATEYAIGCVAVIQEFCAQHSLEHASVHSTTLKKFATGHGNAKKPDMMAAGKAKGWKFADDNECDALWIAEYALRELI